jgi:phosphohistidine phosphatase
VNVSAQPTRILLARHGDAVPEDYDLPDEYRYLSLHGRSKVRGVADVLRSKGVGVDAILTSPLARAVQTAELMGAGLGFQGPIETDLGLLPRSVPMVVARGIRERLASLNTLLVVGHMPAISGLGAELVGMPGFPPLKPGHVLVIDDGQPAFKVDPDRLEVEQFLLS